MAPKLNYQKVVFAFLATASVISLQGCGISTTETTNVDATVQQNDTGAAMMATGKAYNDTAMSGHMMSTGSQTTTEKTGATTTQAQAELNGTFHLKADYNTPAGKEPLDATVTIKNDVITSVTAQNVAISGVSKKFQNMFIEGISGQIVGKNIKDVHVTYVNGSSLTAEAFDKALHALQK